MSTSEKVTIAVAAYAALVATVGIIWQVFTWFHGRALKVACFVSQGLPVGMPSSDWWIMVTVRNREDHPVTVTSAGLYLQGGPERTLVVMHQPLGASLPGVVEPHGSGMTYLEEAEVSGAGIDLRRPLTGWVNLATGETLRSKPVILRA